MIMVSGKPWEKQTKYFTIKDIREHDDILENPWVQYNILNLKIS